MTEVTRFVTRRSGVALVNERLGIPVKKSAVDKARANGLGPKPVARHGKQEIYTEEEFVSWARAQLKPIAERNGGVR